MTKTKEKSLKINKWDIERVTNGWRVNCWNADEGWWERSSFGSVYVFNDMSDLLDWLETHINGD